MMPWRPIVSGALLVLFSPIAGHAQDPWTWDVTLQFGIYNSAERVGPVAPVSPYRFLNLRDIGPAASFGARADLNLPVSGLALTLRGLATFPRDAEGSLDCFPGLACTLILVRGDSEAQVLSGLVGLTYHPWDRSRTFSPFVSGAVGVKQEWVSWEAKPSQDVTAGDRSRSSGAVLVGLGFDLELAGAPLRFEVTDLWTPEGKELRGSFGPSLSSAWPPKLEARHDLNITVGYLLDLH